MNKDALRVEPTEDASLLSTNLNDRLDSFGQILDEFCERLSSKALMAHSTLEQLIAANSEAIKKLTEQAEAIDADNVMDQPHRDVKMTTEILQERLKALTEITELRAEVNHLVISKAEQSFERRLDAMNAREQSAYYVSRPVFEAHIDRLETQSMTLQGYMKLLRSTVMGGGIVLAVLLIITQIIMYRYFWHH